MMNDMKITLARHYGLCFGVRDALKKTKEVAAAGPVTILGQLVHNPVVTEQLAALGAREGRLEAPGSAGTGAVVITAHGAADRDRAAWREAGHRVTDTTCPLVAKAHTALARLVAGGHFPVVIGKRGHVEVRGLTGDFPQAVVVEGEADLEAVPQVEKIGVISQTTQPLERVRWLVARLRQLRPGAEVVFVDTVCQPTKDRQSALEELCRENEVVIVVGGRNSNNTRELVETARKLGARAHHVEGPGDLEEDWFDAVESVGVTAGTSTLEESVRAVVAALEVMRVREQALAC